MNRNRRTTTAPRFMTAKFDGTCAETGKPIKTGDPILYNGKAYSQESKFYSDFQSAEFDRVWLGVEY